MDQKPLTSKDIEKLKEVRKSIFEGNATTYDKNKCLEALDSIIEPKCVVCRQKIEEDVVVVNEKKMHSGCRKRYIG